MTHSFQRLYHRLKRIALYSIGNVFNQTYHEFTNKYQLLEKTYNHVLFRPFTDKHVRFFDMCNGVTLGDRT